MLGLGGIPSIVMFIGFIFMPESPRWYVFHNKTEKAHVVLHKLRDPAVVSQELNRIVDDYEEYTRNKLGTSCYYLGMVMGVVCIGFVSFVKRFLTTRSILLALLVGCGLQMFQQLSGINTVM